jgi:dinuclear metal center YbgI/SA1388 family protein
MPLVAEITKWMGDLAPLKLSESWDNTGLLLGDPASTAERVQTCLTLTPETVQEVIERKGDLVISHHPLPFKPLGKITTETTTGKLLWQLATAGVSVYCPHTAWDSAPLGINALLANKLNLQNCQPLLAAELPELAGLGAGRVGDLQAAASIELVAERLGTLLPDSRPRGVVCPRPIHRVAIACGSGGSLLSAAITQRCDLFLTGEATYHTCLEAQAAGVGLLMIGHFASERFSMQFLAEQLGMAFSSLEVWASESETDPVSSFP